jgi:hypothetical protein
MRMMTPSGPLENEDRVPRMLDGQPAEQRVDRHRQRGCTRERGDRDRSRHFAQMGHQPRFERRRIYAGNPVDPKSTFAEQLQILTSPARSEHCRVAPGGSGRGRRFQQDHPARAGEVISHSLDRRTQGERIEDMLKHGDAQHEIEGSAGIELGRVLNEKSAAVRKACRSSALC